MNTLSVALPLLLLAAVGYLSPADAKTVTIPWGVKPSVVYYIHITNPAFKPPTKPHAPPTKPHKPPTKTPTKPSTIPTKPATTPTPVKKPPPPPVPVPAPSPPSPAVMHPPPAPIVTGRRLLASKFLYPYRYLTEFSKSAGTYKFKTLTVAPGTKLMFRVGSYGSTGHHGLARTSTKYRCGHALETYLRPTSKVTRFTVTLPHKGTYHFYDPTLTPEPIFKKGKVVGHVPQLYDCEHYFISLTVVVT